MGLTTLLRPNKPLGFFIPYRFASQTQRRINDLSYGPVAERLRAEERSFIDLLDRAQAFETTFQHIGTQPPPAPRWAQNWFTGLDAIAAYTLVHLHRPERIVEVGAGHSTRFLAKAISDGATGTQLTIIDPEPRTSVQGLSVHHEECLVTEVPADLWTALQPNDFLSIDSSHILMPGSDVDFLLNQVLPSLPDGVFVHFHDIFLPDTYPADWQWRGYNEQTAVAGLVTSGRFRPVFASHYVAKVHQSTLKTSPLAVFTENAGAPASSLWLQKIKL